MPEMDLEPASDLFPEIYAWYAIQSYLRWPGLGEAGERRTFLLRAVAAAIGDVEAIGGEERPSEAHHAEAAEAARTVIAGDLLQNYFFPLGGFRQLENVPPLTGEVLRDWASVALALSLIRSIDTSHQGLRGGASIKKARFIVVELSKELSATHSLTTNSTYFNKAWQKYKGVSHLCAALHWMFSRGKDMDALGLALFLAVARDYQEFLSAFKTNSKDKTPLVPASIIWSLPSHLHLDWLEVPSGVLGRPLSKEVLAIAQRYTSS